MWWWSSKGSRRRFEDKPTLDQKQARRAFTEYHDKKHGGCSIWKG
jgi:hypothetical protein